MSINIETATHDAYEIFGNKFSAFLESHLGFEHSNLTVLPFSLEEVKENKNLTIPAFQSRVILEKNNFYSDRYFEIDKALDIIVYHTKKPSEFRKGVYFEMSKKNSCFIVYNSSNLESEHVDYNLSDWEEGISLNDYFKL